MGRQRSCVWSVRGKATRSTIHVHAKLSSKLVFIQADYCCRPSGNRIRHSTAFNSIVGDGEFDDEWTIIYKRSGQGRPLWALVGLQVAFLFVAAYGLLVPCTHATSNSSRRVPPKLRLNPWTVNSSQTQKLSNASANTEVFFTKKSKQIRIN